MKYESQRVFPEGRKSEVRSEGKSSQAELEKSGSGFEIETRFIQKFWSRVNKNGPIQEHVPEIGNCWQWTGVIASNGYGIYTIKGKTCRAHRLSYLLAGGKIPTGQECCHKCDNRKCVRLDHLFSGTRSENMLDASKKGRLRNAEMDKTRCSRGHEFSTENTWVMTGRTGKPWRWCRKCMCIRSMQARERAKLNKQEL